MLSPQAAVREGELNFVPDRLRRRRPRQADAEWADAIVLGTPTRFGGVAAERKAHIDGPGGLWFHGKYGASSVSHGQENRPPTADDLEVARFQGRRVTQVATALRVAA